MPVEQFERSEQIGVDEMLSHYTNFDRLEQILLRKEIFFPRSKVLRGVDEREGILPRREQEHRKKDAMERFNFPPQGSDRHKEMTGQLEALEARSDNMVVKCFHRNAEESMHMWQNFTADGRGVMIRTTLRRICASFSSTEEAIVSSPVRYVDPDTAILYDPTHYPVPANNSIAPHILKTEKFSHEAELRLIHAPDKSPWEWEAFWSSQEIPKGLFIKVDPCLLIEEIVVPPGSSKEYVEEVQALINTYCPGVHVRQSSLEP